MIVTMIMAMLAKLRADTGRNDSPYVCPGQSGSPANNRTYTRRKPAETKP